MLIHSNNISLGTDPELFLENKFGMVMGSERLIPEDGVETYDDNRIIRDGVQVELNVGADMCREFVGRNLKDCFKQLRSLLAEAKEQGKDLTLCFKPVVKVDENELNLLSIKSREFGCARSYNIYRPDAVVGVDASTYLTRSAGGHIHVGNLPSYIFYDKSRRHFWDTTPHPEVDERRRLVPIFDVLVGIPSVMIDREPGQEERRKYYGRAGEYRLPKYGIEYRTLSNFWLRNYKLMSLVMGLTRMGVGVLDTTLNPEDDKRKDLEKALLEKVDFAKVIRAIDTNDVVLATECFEYVEKFVTDHVRSNAYNRGEIPLIRPRLARFKAFAKEVQENGLESIFPGDPIDNWLEIKPLDGGWGWESFIDRRYKGVK